MTISRLYGTSGSRVVSGTSTFQVCRDGYRPVSDAYERPSTVALWPASVILRIIADEKDDCLTGGKAMRNMLRHLYKDEEGQDLTEYGLLLVLIALVAIATMGKLGSAINNVFSNAAASLSTSS